MTTNYAPVADKIRLIRGDGESIRCPLPTTARRIDEGDLLWDNTTSGVEPFNMKGNANATTLGDTLAPLFVGVSAEKRLLVQDLSATDASRKVIQVYADGIFACPCAAIASNAVEIGSYVRATQFTNEASTGFTDASNASVKNTSYYSYNNSVEKTTDASQSLGKVVQRAEIGDTTMYVKFHTMTNTLVRPS